ncbi:MAG: 50S ribosomal protein L17 [Dehalococcoidia bacterium]|nr:MAG: 50S ribosomal protein L17 [Dehalococcoidia bacterium]
MRHQIAGKKLGRSTGQRTALRKTLINQFLEHERIRTTRAKAQAIRGEVEKLVTLAKAGNKAGDQKMVNARRAAASRLGNAESVKRLFDKIAPRYEKTKGGYTRILRVGLRKGDAAEMVLLEFVE